MEYKHFRVGMRTVKTGVAVALCVLLFKIIGRGVPMIAMIAAIFALREDWQSSMRFGKTRLFGNSLGAIFAALLIILRQIIGQSQQTDLIEVIGLPLVIMIMIVFCDSINYNSGIIGASATFLIIYFTIPANETILFALERILDTFLGTFIAIAVNRFLPGGPISSKKMTTTQLKK